MQAALSIVTAHQATLETALHDYVSESDKSRRKVKALEKSVACKDREITRLKEKVEECVDYFSCVLSALAITVFAFILFVCYDC